MAREVALLGVGGTFLWDFTYLCWNLTNFKISVLLPFLEGLGYKTAHCEFNKAH
jgi:hypothetical protein